MRPLGELDPRGVTAVLFDLDDTLTTSGKLTAQAYAALERLEAAERIAALMRHAGLTARISSIHVNGWFGEYDKLAMTRRLFRERFDLELEAANRQIVFAGDSPNDAPMFGFFENSVGVANVRRFEGRLAAAPKYLTQEAAGAGFAELAAHLLGAAA